MGSDCTCVGTEAGASVTVFLTWVILNGGSGTVFAMWVLVYLYVGSDSGTSGFKAEKGNHSTSPEVGFL